MNSIKTKSKNYFLLKDKAIGGIVVVPEKNHLDIYVAWEWEIQAERGVFAICHSKSFCKIGQPVVQDEEIEHVCRFGKDVTHKAQARKLFPNLFQTIKP